ERDDGLADVNELGGAAPYAVAAEQPPAVAVEQHLEHALLVAADRAARYLLVPGDAALIRDLLRGELLLGRADHRHFRNRVDPHREVLAHRVRVVIEHRAGGQAPLLARRRRQRWEPYDVTGRPDV